MYDGTSYYDPADYEPHTVTVSKCTGRDHDPDPRTVTIYSPDQEVYCDRGHRMHG